MYFLGIETSCDETAAAVVAREVSGEGRIIAQVVRSQYDEHAPYGGVVPEIASRAHIAYLDRLIARCMEASKLDWADLDGIAVTAGPGLIGGVITGVMTAKGIALAHGLPLMAVNHLEGHALTVRLTHPEVTFPYLLLLVSGGHCQLLITHGVGRYTVLGTTLDDAVGEAFDKTAKLLGLGYPGGPAVEAAAREGNPARFVLPMPLKDRPGCDFSFSGLKTAVRRTAEKCRESGAISTQDIADLCASFQFTVGEILADRVKRAITQFRETYPDGQRLVVAGGVAANRSIRARLSRVADTYGMEFTVPPPALCTDNAAMIAWAGAERFALGLTDSLDIEPRARWPLEEQALSETS